MAESSSDIDRDLLVLEAELKRLEAEYNMFFAGRLPRPPWETRGRVDALVKRLDRMRLANYGHRFRFSTLQARYSTFVDLWDRALRAREEGRPSPLFRSRDMIAAKQPTAAPSTPVASPPESAEPSEPAAAAAAAEGPRAITFTDPRQEDDKLQTLYDVLMDARRQAGESNIPFHKFADLVKEQAQRLKKKGLDEVTFSVTTTDGRVNLTAKGSKPTS